MTNSGQSSKSEDALQMLPHSLPQLTQVQALQLLSGFSSQLHDYPVIVLGIRGYYKKTMGNPLTNDVGIYDDALFIIGPHHFSSYNANTDPSVLRKGVAVLKVGTVTMYKVGLHNMKNPYEALRQYGRVTVIRDGREETDTKVAPFYIDIHKGGFTTTSSLGCQTIHPNQWQSFISTMKDQLKRVKQTLVPYVLTEI